MIDKEILKLLGMLEATNSPSERKSIVLTFCLKQGNYQEQKNDIDALLAIYEKKIADKKEQGHAAIRAREGRKNKTKREQYTKPKFFTDYAGGALCASCGTRIDPGSAFRHKIGADEYVTYHCTPDCFPEEFKEIMLIDRDFRKKFGNI